MIVQGSGYDLEELFHFIQTRLSYVRVTDLTTHGSFFSTSLTYSSKNLFFRDGFTKVIVSRIQSFYECVI